jgi:hypothetical protein
MLRTALNGPELHPAAAFRRSGTLQRHDVDVEIGRIGGRGQEADDVIGGPGEVGGQQKRRSCSRASPGPSAGRPVRCGPCGTMEDRNQRRPTD